MTEELEPGFEMLPSDDRRPRRSAKLLTAVGAVVVLAGGGVASYAALAGDDPGSNSPQAAVAKVLDDLTHSDLLGVIDDLAPGERDALRGAFTSDVASLKRLGVLTNKANPSSVGGVTFAAHNLKYGAALKVSANVQIVRIDGGTVDASAALAKLPLTNRLLKLAKADTPQGTSSSHHVITAADPLRLAAQKVGGRWYASVFYTVADAAADHKAPSASDRIAAKGAASAEAAVRAMITDLVGGNVRDAIALISPAELGALHDYGGALADKTHPSRTPFTIGALELSSTATDGGTKVTIKKLEATVMGQQLTIELSRGCVKISSAFINKNLCGADIADTISGFVTLYRCRTDFNYGTQGTPTPLSSSRRSQMPFSYRAGGRLGACKPPTFTAAQKTAMTHLFSALLSAGVVTTQIDGKWYIAPVRTLADLSSSTLSALKGDDLFALATLGR